MKFSNFDYKRPDYKSIKEIFYLRVKEIEKASTYEEQKRSIEKLNVVRNNIESMSTISSIRYSINTEDEFYEKERGYWDEYSPLYEELNSLFYKAIVNSKFKENIIKDYGRQFFKIVEYSLKSFSSEIIDELQEENRLCSEYTKLLASAKIDFEGEERNLSGLGSFMLSEDRSMREKASKAYYEYFEANENKFDDVFDKLVKVRSKIANKLGFENFVEVGYIRMMRTDYNSKMVSNFRNQVLKYIVPLAEKLYERQEKRLNLKEFTYIDENFEFLTGNATPKGTPEYIIENGKQMYSELSKDTKEFFEFMPV